MLSEVLSETFSGTLVVGRAHWLWAEEGVSGQSMSKKGQTTEGGGDMVRARGEGRAVGTARTKMHTAYKNKKPTRPDASNATEEYIK